jgi:hypothetical protein
MIEEAKRSNISHDKVSIAKYIGEFLLALKEGHLENNYPYYEIYSKEKPSDLLPRFLKCFEENIYDIPEGSIIWDTPLLKETMSNYKALKEYAKE